MSFDAAAYLARLGLAAPPAPDLAGLTALVRAQMAAIPFENTEPLAGTVPDVSPEWVWRKLVAQRRGGYCFELNGLLGRALAAFGFDVRPVMARVRNGRPEGGERSHLAWLVSLPGGEFLADCGFGGPCPDLPVPLSGAEAGGLTGTWRLVPGDGETVLEGRAPEGWRPLFAFDRAPVRPPDIVAANFVCALAPFKPFSSHLMAARLTPSGRATLLDRRLTLAGEARDLTGPEDLATTLADIFTLPPDPALANTLWQRLPKDTAAA